MGKSAKRERQRANREAKQERQAKDERRRQVIRFGWRAVLVLLLVITAGLVISNLGGSSSDVTTTTTTTTTTPTTSSTTATTAATDATEPDSTTATTVAAEEGLSAAYQAFVAQPTACGAATPAPPEIAQFDSPEDQGIAAGTTLRATLVTSCGDIVIELDPTVAPESVNSFAFLARQGYWDGTVSHRLVPGFVVQFGDPTATGTGGPGYTIVDEFPEEGFAYDRGVVAMAKAGPDSTGSQFFLPFAATGLDAEFNPIGRVVEGIEILDLIEAVPVNGQTPLESVYLEQVLIEGG